MMLRHLGETAAAERVEKSIREIIAEGQTVPRDLGGTAGTRAFGRAVAERVAAA
jgi:isocitrate dehydrogenase (NAD+)